MFEYNELLTINDGILALIENAKKAKELVHDAKTKEAIDIEINTLYALLSKSCNYAKEINNASPDN